MTDTWRMNHDPAALASAVSAVERTLSLGADSAATAAAAVEAYMLAAPAKAADSDGIQAGLVALVLDESRSADERSLLARARQALSFACRREEARRLDPLPMAELSKLIEDEVATLGELWTRTGKDWILEVHHVLTEPVCPTVNIRPEGSGMVRYAVHAETIAEGIIRSVDLVRKDILLGEAAMSEAVDADRSERESSLQVDPEDPVAVENAWRKAEHRLEDVSKTLLGERAERRRLESELARLRSVVAPS